MKTTTYLASKPRYEILDGLRGVAAMIVVAFHLFETYSAGPAHQILNHGYLAVDFFFVLSGFVIGYAYDDRWDRMTTWDFFKRRLVRLHPMVIMGTLLGASLFYFSACSAFPMVMQTPWWKVLLMTLLGCLMFPTPTSWDIRGWWETNALNGPTWSLMWEYIANVLYALFIRRFSKLALHIRRTLRLPYARRHAQHRYLRAAFIARRSRLHPHRRLEPDARPALYRHFAPALSLLHGTAAVSHRQVSKGEKRILLVFPAGNGYPRDAAHRRRDQPMDERRLRSRKRTRPLSADSGYGSRQQRHGQAFRSPLQVPGRTVLSAVHHTLPADIHADSLGTE